VVKSPWRKGVKDGKQGHIEADLNNVKVCPLIFNLSKRVPKNRLLPFKALRRKNRHYAETVKT
jgi:hypothetical protein